MSKGNAPLTPHSLRSRVVHEDSGVRLESRSWERHTIVSPDGRFGTAPTGNHHWRDPSAHAFYILWPRIDTGCESQMKAIRILDEKGIHRRINDGPTKVQRKHTETTPRPHRDHTETTPKAERRMNEQPTKNQRSGNEAGCHGMVDFSDVRGEPGGLEARRGSSPMTHVGWQRQSAVTCVGPT